MSEEDQLNRETRTIGSSQTCNRNQIYTGRDRLELLAKDALQKG